MRRFVCIHGHFYQPPRENAWLERIERQESAKPFHDWNARIDSECYGPNGRARILDGDEHVVTMLNNFARISFNVGPTLLSWMELHAPNTYQRILEADRQSEKTMGHGSAMAQAYGHIIMPLANERDRRTQVRWGIADFRHRFGRAPEGMWLPETAMCTASLRAMADEGILFTIAAPSQAAAIRRKGEDAFVPVATRPLDTRRPYRVDVGDGKSIAVFFYDGATSTAVAFERLLSNGDAFASRLEAAFSSEPRAPELVHIATDGETYGHHHRFGEMALAYALRRFERDPSITLTNYASFLAAHPPVDEAMIVERSAWSCAHGVGRWSADCGCRTDGSKSQAWRGPLRDSLNWLRDRIDVVYAREAELLFKDPWEARDGYIELVLERGGDARRRAFIDRYGAGELDDRQRMRALSLLEMQRHRMLMFTSCGWFFDDVFGLETTQILQYAARAVELARSECGEELEPDLCQHLAVARPNTHDAVSAREVYEKHALPAQVSAARLAATFATTSLFSIPMLSAPALELDEQEVRLAIRDDRRFAVGRLTVTSAITGRVVRYVFAVHHAGGPAVRGGLREVSAKEVFDAEDWIAAFEEEPDEIEARVERELPIAFDLKTLPVDERVAVVERVLAQAVREAELAYRQVFRDNAALLTELAILGVKAPRALAAASRVVLESDLLRAVRRDPTDTRALRNLVAEARSENIPFDEPMLAFEISRAVGRTCAALEGDPANDGALGRLIDLVEIARRVHAPCDLSRAQDLVWDVVNEPSSPIAKAASDKARIGVWRELAVGLRVRNTVRG